MWRTGDMTSKRTKAETIELFREYAYSFRLEARNMEKSCMMNEMNFLLGKAEAYENSAFELERNME